MASFPRRLLCVSMYCRVAGTSPSYTAAAVEFAPEQAAGNASREAIASVKARNVERLAAYAKEAKQQGAQIIVFPEYGITGDGVSNADFSRSSIAPYLESVPANATDVCDQAAVSQSSPSIAQMSCLARELHIVVVFNLLTRVPCTGQTVQCPSDGQYVHNTAIAVAEDGSILSVYNKRHPFGDEAKYLDASMNTTKARFTTSFGVEFGMFICFDIFWEWRDADVANVVFPTDWVNGVLGPLGPSARAAQQAWSTLHQKNLIAANYGGFGSEGSGSGIYHNGNVLASFFNPTKKPESRLLIAEIPGVDSTTQYV